ncbi:hypothetical protein KVT40_004665 [Elsinoe batatas]|uniref:Uncharacterized protein n=1 Tax=Elsinoe batatas TaxID=2601811 RepID=A0A8K0PG44_9PEZI|nr:hypothetical protein KVT40_004665 [Elsinoe batatas]
MRRLQTLIVVFSILIGIYALIWAVQIYRHGTCAFFRATCGTFADWMLPGLYNGDTAHRTSYWVPGEGWKFEYNFTSEELAEMEPKAGQGVGWYGRAVTCIPRCKSWLRSHVPHLPLSLWSSSSQVDRQTWQYTIVNNTKQVSSPRRKRITQARGLAAMPPRKRRTAATTSSPPPSHTSTAPSPDASASNSADALSTISADPAVDLLSDPWTDAEETALYRALIRHKPTGLHKHFRMLDIYLGLVSQGYVRENPAGLGLGLEEKGRGKGTKVLLETQDGEGDIAMADAGAGDGEDDIQESIGFSESYDGRHTSIRGIWRKLHSLYDLEALDERELEGDYERAFGTTSSAASSSSEDETTTTRRTKRSRKASSPSKSPAPIGKEFHLPTSPSPSRDSPSFTHLMWAKRFPSPSPSLPGSGPPSPSTTNPKRSRTARPKLERRDSSPAQMPELLPSRHEPPIKFQPSFTVPSDGEGDEGGTPVRTTEKEKTTKRGRGRPSKSSLPAAGAQGKGRESNITRRSSRVATNTNESEEEEEGEEEGSGEEEGGEEDDEEEESSSEEEEEQDSPQKKTRGGGRGRGRGRGGGRRGGRGKK